MLTIRQYEQKGYERFVIDLPDKPCFIEFLKLESLPHFTALQKFAKRAKQTVLELVLAMALVRTGIKKIVGGVDGTGNKPNRASFYYVYRRECFARKNKQMKRGYSKKEFHQRNKNETVNSVVKRKYGDGTLALSWRMQNKEVIFRLILYAARRFTSIILFILSIKIIIPLKRWESYVFLEEGFL